MEAHQKVYWFVSVPKRRAKFGFKDVQVRSHWETRAHDRRGGDAMSGRRHTCARRRPRVSFFVLLKHPFFLSRVRRWALLTCIHSNASKRPSWARAAS